jgi:hypothetical protein
VPIETLKHLDRNSGRPISPCPPIHAAALDIRPSQELAAVTGAHGRTPPVSSQELAAGGRLRRPPSPAAHECSRPGCLPRPPYPARPHCLTRRPRRPAEGPLPQPELPSSPSSWWPSPAARTATAVVRRSRRATPRRPQGRTGGSPSASGIGSLPSSHPLPLIA